MLKLRAQFTADKLIAILNLNARVRQSDVLSFEVGRTISLSDRMDARGCDEMLPLYVGSAADAQRIEEELIAYSKRNWPFKCTNESDASLGPVVGDMHVVYCAIIKRR